MKKVLTKVLSLTLVVALVASLSACGKKKERALNEILLWAGGQWVGTDAENLEKFINYYNENNTKGYTIDLEIIPDFEQTFAGAMNTNKGPDLMIWDRFNTPSYVYDEVLLPLDDLISKSNVKAADFNKTAYDELSYEGKQYGLPLDLDMWGMYINMDIVEAYNEANPSTKITCLWNEDGSNKLDWTWDDLYEVSKKLKGFSYTKNGIKIECKSGYNGGDINEFFYHNYVSTGESFLNEKGEADFNNDKGAAVLKNFYRMYKDTWTAGYVDKAAFVQGQLAIYTQPTYFVSYLNNYASGLTNVRFMPQPKYPGEGGMNRGVLGGYGLAIPKPIEEKNRTEAWEQKVEVCYDFMVDWVHNTEMMSQWVEISETIPALLSTHDLDAIKSHRILKDALPYSNSYTIRPSVPGWKDIQVNVFNSYVPSFCKGNDSSDAKISQVLNTMQKGTNDLIDMYK